MKRLLIALAITGICSLPVVQKANAGIIIEPYVGYETGDSEDTTGADKSPKGVTFGGRLGLTTLGFMYGVEFSTGAIKDGVMYKTTDTGLFVGYELPILLRGYFSYMLKSEATLETSGLADVKWEGNGGTKIGIGYTGLPFFAINLEQITRKYDTVSGSNSNKEIKTTMISISLPLP